MLGPIVLAAAAIAVAVCVAVAAAGRLRRNPYAGIRIPALYASEDAWKHGHRAAAPLTTGSAVICVVLVLVALVEPPFFLVGTILETVALVVGVLGGTLLASRASRRPSGQA